MKKIKYPKTMHLPYSLAISNDDKIIENLDAFIGKRIIVTEKMDGENSTISKYWYHARSLDSTYHESRSHMKVLQASIGYAIPEGIRICGENLFARHSIPYCDLPSYFLAFSVWDGDTCFSWDDTVEYLELFELHHVPVIYDGLFSDAILRDITKQIDTKTQEGFVVRVANSFYLEDFDKCVAKWVRAKHVQTDKHWMHKPLVMNKLKDNK